jgi:hypothetical protein
MIRAIPTDYRGQRFRSRTEVKWAIFFDSLPLAFEYEPEGYTDGEVRYLPDFYLPTPGVYVEVKGEERFDERKIRLAVAATGKPVVVAVGEPRLPLRLKTACRSCRWHANNGLYVYAPDEDGTVVRWPNRAWSQCRSCGRFDLDYGSYGCGNWCCCPKPGQLPGSTMIPHTAALHRAYGNAQTKVLW